MTREEAINLLGWLKSKTNRDDDLEAIDMAIEALAVVRCKDCKYYHTSEMYSYCNIINVKGRSPKQINFCSYGERREP